MCTYIYIYTYMYTYVCLCMKKDICMHGCVYVCRYVPMYRHMYVCTYVSVCLCGLHAWLYILRYPPGPQFRTTPTRGKIAVATVKAVFRPWRGGNNRIQVHRSDVKARHLAELRKQTSAKAHWTERKSSSDKDLCQIGAGSRADNADCKFSSSRSSNKDFCNINNHYYYYYCCCCCYYYYYYYYFCYY